ncbi:MAG: alpha/beta fold hydrolase [Solirubrobacterales bacterium]|nr:alpha/beta fold hydrolase [Solirubrobacterales bacterium]
MRLRLALPLAVAALAAPASSAAAASIADAPIRTVKAGQGKIGYRSVGTGRPLVLVMGLSGTMDAWSPSFVDALAKGRRVVAFDNEGIRRTTMGKGSLTIERMGDDTASLIRALKLRRADVLGWSMGGMIAQSLAVRHPRLVRRVVLAATTPGDGRATPPTPAALQLLMGGGADPALGLLGMLFPPGQEAATNAFISGMAAYPRPLPRAPAAVVQKQVAASAGWMAGRDPAGKAVRRLKVPVLVGAGALDQVLPVANQRHLAAIVKGARLHVFDDAAHGFLFQHQAEWVPEVDAFLDRR